MPNFADAWLTTALGLVTVFVVLIIIWGIMELMRVFFYRPGKSEQTVKVKETVQEINIKQSVDTHNEKELIAVIMAAIAASLNTSTANLKIKSFKQVGAKYKSTPTDFERI